MGWKDVIRFWFEEIEPKQKYKKDPDFDALIRDKFEKTYWEVVYGEHEDWRAKPEGRLAEIVVLDQFSRNMFRDDAKAFMYDPLALALAQEAIRVGADKEVDEKRRSAFYMPFMHSESKVVHKRGMELFKESGDEMGLEYMKKHKDIIDEFGRYPHRNEILGRESTETELEHINIHGGF